MTSTSPTAIAAPPDLAGPYRWRWLALVAILGAEVMDLLDVVYRLEQAERQRPPGQ